MPIKTIIKQIQENLRYEHASSFKEELHRQCNAYVIPASLLTMFSWLFYIPLDRNLYGGFPLIVYLRWGLFVLGIIIFTLFFTPYFKRKAKGYLLMYFIVYYGGYASAVILGMVAADPIYMGGFAIVIMLIAVVPIQRRHAYFILFSSLLLFVLVGLMHGMTFKLSSDLYGLYNLIVASSISSVSIFLFDGIRRNSFEKGLVIKKTNEELKKANKTKSELLQIAAHDLKDPLQVIIGYTDMLQMKYQGDRFAKDKLEKIYRSTDHMIKLITGLLEISSIESGKLVLNEIDINVGRMAREVVKNHQDAAEKKNQEITCETVDDLVVIGDEMLLRQVLENLVGNAVKFSPPGKTIWVSVSRADSTASFKIRDEGPGLTEEDKKKLFGKFQRLSAKPTGKESSTGLGLALTKELVVLHGGTIRVESEYGNGCKFIVELPVKEGVEG